MRLGTAWVLVQPLLGLDAEEQICHPLFQGAVSDRSRAKHSPWSSEVLFWCADPWETGLCDFCIQTAYPHYKFNPTEACCSLTRALSWGLFSSVRGHWALLEMFLVLMTWEEGELPLESSGWKPGMLQTSCPTQDSPQSKEVSSPHCQWCQGGETLVWVSVLQI